MVHEFDTKAMEERQLARVRAARQPQAPSPSSFMSRLRAQPRPLPKVPPRDEALR